MNHKKKVFALLVFSFAFALPAFAQFTQVSATVVDPNSIPYVYGSVSAVLVTPGGGPGAVITATGQSCCGPRNAVLDGNGAFVMQLEDNALVTPAATKWQFTVNETPGIQPPLGYGSVSFSVTLTITGATQSISTQLNAAAPALGRSSGGGPVYWNGIGQPTGNFALNMLGNQSTWTSTSPYFTGTAYGFKWVGSASDTSTGPLGWFSVPSGSTMPPLVAEFNGNGVKVGTDGLLDPYGSGYVNATALPTVTMWLGPDQAVGTGLATTANVYNISGLPSSILNPISGGHLVIAIQTADGTNNSDFGIATGTPSGTCTVRVTTGAQTWGSTGIVQPASTGSIPASTGSAFRVYFIWTSNSTTIKPNSGSITNFRTQTTAGSTSGGSLGTPGVTTFTCPADVSWVAATTALVDVIP